jgi:hypothetical protein
MRKKRAPRTTASTTETLQQANVSVTVGDRSAPKLPHERDQSVATPARPAKRIVQAELDLVLGRQDTDCYSAAIKAFSRARRRQRRA